MSTMKSELSARRSDVVVDIPDGFPRLYTCSRIDPFLQDHFCRYLPYEIGRNYDYQLGRTEGEPSEVKSSSLYYMCAKDLRERVSYTPDDRTWEQRKTDVRKAANSNTEQCRQLEKICKAQRLEDRIQKMFVFGLDSIAEPLVGYEALETAASRLSIVKTIIEHMRLEDRKFEIYIEDPFFHHQDKALVEAIIGGKIAKMRGDTVSVTVAGENLLKYSKNTEGALVVSVHPSNPIRQIVADLSLDEDNESDEDSEDNEYEEPTAKNWVRPPAAIICAPYYCSLEHDPLTSRVQEFLVDNYKRIPILKDNDNWGPLTLHLLRT